METLQYDVQMQCIKTQLSICDNDEFCRRQHKVSKCVSHKQSKIVIKAVIYFDSIDLKSP